MTTTNDDSGSGNADRAGNEKGSAEPYDGTEKASPGALSRTPVGAEKDAPTPAEQRAENRRRRRMIDEIAESLGTDDEETKRLLVLISEIIPDPSRMSTAAHVGDRLEHALAEQRARHPRLLSAPRTRNPIDLTDHRRAFADNPNYASLLDSEEELYRALIVNDRACAGYELKVHEHDIVRSLLIEELIRRQTTHEQWRHLLPKSMLPIYSMIHAAGVRAKDLQINSRLFNKVRDMLVEWSGGKVDRGSLLEAAKRSEDAFMAALKEDGEASIPQDQSFDACRERLRLALTEARTDLEKLDGLDVDEIDFFEARARVDRLKTAISTDAGMDAVGRLVFPSVDTFIDAIAARRRAHRGIGAEDVGEADGVSVVASEDAATPVADKPGEGADDAGTGGVISQVEEPEAGADPDHELEIMADPTGSVDTQADVCDGPSARDFGPDIPEDLFGPQVLGSEDDQEAEGGPNNHSDADQHSSQETAVTAASPDIMGDGSDEESDDALAPIGDGPLAFDPAKLVTWPSDNMQVRRIALGLTRSTGLSRSTFDKPFSMWRPSVEPPPFCFMGFRLQPDLSAREGREGPIEPVDLSRLEIGDGQWKAATVPGFSRILGESHPLMLPPHSRLEWYGRTLGWNETDIRSLSGFGSPANPETVTPKGDGRMLADAMRGVARLRLAKLVQRVPEHFLADEKAGSERRAEAVEDLARYWIFVLLARHDQAGFDLMFEDGFFQGVHGPDFAVTASGVADFGGAEKGGHIWIFSPELMRTLPSPNPLRPYVGTMGDGVTSGIRRTAV